VIVFNSLIFVYLLDSVSSFVNYNINFYKTKTLITTKINYNNDFYNEMLKDKLIPSEIKSLLSDKNYESARDNLLILMEKNKLKYANNEEILFNTNSRTLYLLLAFLSFTPLRKLIKLNTSTSIFLFLIVIVLEILPFAIIIEEVV
jgi:uncharacterized protein YacL